MGMGLSSKVGCSLSPAATACFPAPAACFPATVQGAKLVPGRGGSDVCNGFFGYRSRDLLAEACHFWRKPATGRSSLTCQHVPGFLIAELWRACSGRLQSSGAHCIRRGPRHGLARCFTIAPLRADAVGATRGHSVRRACLASVVLMLSPACGHSRAARSCWRGRHRLSELARGRGRRGVHAPRSWSSRLGPTAPPTR